MVKRCKNPPKNSNQNTKMSQKTPKTLNSAFDIRLSAFVVGVCSLVMGATSQAQPFGVGVYGADVPFGDLTSISIDLTADTQITLSPLGGGVFGGDDSQTITVTSTDVIGYDLYINAKTDTNLANGANTIAASANITPNTLSTNTWGYNTTNSPSVFKGIQLTQDVLTSKTGPYKNGDDTTVTYGVKVDGSKAAGTYTTDVTYTAVGRT